LESPSHAAGSDAPVGILVVDDHEENRVALRAILSSPEYRITEASSGAEALRLMLSQEFAVLLLDVVMPGMNGFEVASTIREREKAAEVPILFVTGQAADAEHIYKGYRVGAIDYLVKPLSPEMVRAKVAVFAALYRQRKRIERQAALLVEAERRESELRLVEARLLAERRYRALADAVPDIIFTARPDGRVDYFNQRWFELTGVSAEQAAGSWQAALHPDDAAEHLRGFREAVQLGRMFEDECRLRRSADGAYRWHLCRALPERGVGGQIVSWLGTFTDIEDQKRVEAVLVEFKETLDAVLDAVMIYQVGTWRFLYVNHGASVLLPSSCWRTSTRAVSGSSSRRCRRARRARSRSRRAVAEEARGRSPSRCRSSSWAATVATSCRSRATSRRGSSRRWSASTSTRRRSPRSPRETISSRWPRTS
jgi:PAS domain S-box-containing protein